MNKVIFTVGTTTKDSYIDFGLILKPRTRTFPNPRFKKIQIQGKSGSLDLSESLTGEIEYDDVIIPLEFNVIDAMNTWETKKTTLANFLHGRKTKIVFSDDSGYYYYGTCKINEFTSDRNLGTLSLECECNPYKYKKDKTIVTNAVTGNEVITLTNSRMSVVPKIITTAAINFTFNEKSYSINGTVINPNIQLKEGNNVFTITSGTGNITFEFQEGDL